MIFPALKPKPPLPNCIICGKELHAIGTEAKLACPIHSTRGVPK